MINPIKITTTFAVAVLLGGCNNLLYSDSVAPVYSKTQPSGQVARTTAPRPINRGSTASTVSIENPNQPAVVNQAQNDPYARSSRNPVITQPQPQTAEPIIRPPAVGNPTQNPVSNTASNQGVAVQQPRAGYPNTAAASQSAEQVLSESAKAARSNDPRIREATDVLNAEQSAMDTHASEAEKLARTAEQVAGANRPTAVKEAAVRRAEAAKQTATQRVEQTTKTASKQVETVQKAAAETATAATVVATSAQSTATAAVTPPQPASPTSATKVLLKDARTAVAAGDYEKAASSLERAHRIQPGNAKILYDIAQIRYAQGKFRQAESFASKAANYSKSTTLSKKIWTILANSRRALGNTTGAAAAAKKAANF